MFNCGVDLNSGSIGVVDHDIAKVRDQNRDAPFYSVEHAEPAKKLPFKS